jgi:hypothetical protein
MMIPYEHQSVVLHGIVLELIPGDKVQLYQMSVPNDQNDGTAQVLLTKSIIPEVQQLLKEYNEVFAAAVEFPPPRSCCHSIPLIPGARPVSIRPYRFAPALKDEIERQVHDMLKARLIQNSMSPFSSPVLLVKKGQCIYILYGL